MGTNGNTEADNLQGEQSTITDERQSPLRGLQETPNTEVIGSSGRLCAPGGLFQSLIRGRPGVIDSESSLPLAPRM